MIPSLSTPFFDFRPRQNLSSPKSEGAASQEFEGEGLALLGFLERARASLYSGWSPMRVGLLVAVALAYFLTGRLGMRFSLWGSMVSPVWPPTGIALAVFLLFGRQIWPAIWVGAFWANFSGLAHGTSLGALVSGVGIAAAMGLGGTFTAALGAELVRRFAGNRHPLEEMRGVLALAGLGGLLSCVLSATNGVLWLCLAHPEAWKTAFELWKTWWLGDVAGVFVFAPFVLAWATVPSVPAAGRSLEAVLCFGLLALATSNVFLDRFPTALDAKPFTFVLIPFLAWPALRFGSRGAMSCALIVCGLSVWATGRGEGPFQLATLNESLLVLESFLCVVTGTSMCVAAVSTQATRAEAARRRLFEDLEARVSLRTAALLDSNAALETEVRLHEEAREALRLSEERLSLALRGGALGTWDRDVLSGCVIFNERWSAMLGYAPSEVEAHVRGWEALVHPEDLPRVSQLLEAHLRGETPYFEAEYRMRHQSGRWVWVLDKGQVVRRSGAGMALRLAGTHEDISARKNAEVALQLSEEKVRRLAAFPRLNPNPVLELSASAEILYGNDAATALARTLGFEQPLEMLPAQTAALVSECLSTQKSRADLEWVCGQRIIAWSFHPVPAQGVVHCYALDITETRQLAEQFRQAQKMEAVGQLAGGVAHDFNNILAAILIHSELGLASEDLSESARDTLNGIRVSAERAAGLTRQLLLFSRREVIQPRTLDLNAEVLSFARMIQRILGEDIAVRLGLSAQALPVKADPGMLEQVLMNLAVNARDAMPEGGRLTLETSARFLVPDAAPDSASSPQSAPGHYACLIVSDSGSGIAPETLPHIFEPFFTTKGPGKGTGLGLASVFGIIKQHGGWARVTSEPDRGTVFHIYLPLQEAETLPQLEPAPVELPARQQGGETVLLVEDEKLVRTATRHVLEMNGYRVIEAVHGVEALSIWEAHGASVDLLFTDLVMPEGVGGQELARRLKLLRPDLKVLFTSGYSAEMAGRELDLAEGQNFLQKPASAKKILETIRATLDGK